jgi:hypothetical protein
VINFYESPFLDIIFREKIRRKRYPLGEMFTFSFTPQGSTHSSIEKKEGTSTWSSPWGPSLTFVGPNFALGANLKTSL